MNEVTAEKERRSEMLKKAYARNLVAVREGIQKFSSHQSEFSTLQETPVRDLVVELYRRVQGLLTRRR